MKTRITFASFSEIGQRQSNQDVCMAVEMPEQERTLLVVCDGMGGHALGDMAAQTVGQALCDYWLENAIFTDSPLKVKEACEIAAQELVEKSEGQPAGTTMVMASMEKQRVTIAHCGDSRCYLIRNHQIVYQTRDHAHPIVPGAVTRCFFSTHPKESAPEIAQFDLQSGDRLFLCSDGVYKSIAPTFLNECLLKTPSLEEAIQAIKSQCEDSSYDNYTGILAQIEID